MFIKQKTDNSALHFAVLYAVKRVIGCHRFEVHVFVSQQERK